MVFEDILSWSFSFLSNWGAPLGFPWIFVLYAKLEAHKSWHFTQRNLLSRNFVNMLPQSHNMNLQCLSLLYWQTIASVLFSFVFCLSFVFVPPSPVYYPKWIQALLDATNLCYKRSLVSVQDWPICHEQFNLYCRFFLPASQIKVTVHVELLLGWVWLSFLKLGFLKKLSFQKVHNEKVIFQKIRGCLVCVFK